MQVREISTNFGATFIGNYLGCHEGSHAMSDVYRIIPTPVYTNGIKSIINYEPSLLQISFFGDNDQVIYFKQEDIFIMFEVNEVNLKKFNDMVKLKQGEI